MDCVRCKEPIDIDSNFCKKCGMQQDDNSTPEINNGYSPKVGRTYPQKESTGQKAVGYGIAIAIVIGLGILTGALLRAGSP